jgi:murein L,D-transpeptidase YcbB/YkuD
MWGSRPIRFAILLSTSVGLLRPVLAPAWAQNASAPPVAVSPAQASAPAAVPAKPAEPAVPAPSAPASSKSAEPASVAPPAPASIDKAERGTPAAPVGSPSPAAAPPVGRQPAPVPRPKPPAPLKLADLSKDPRPTLSPQTFIATVRAADRYRRIAEAGGWPLLPTGAPLKIGDKGPAVALLKQRLSVTGDLPSDAARGALFDDRVTAAVKLFQARHGLPETGLVGPRTVQAMNVPAEVRFRQLVQSALRVTGSKFPFSERYVVVNIPSAAVEAVQGGQVVRRYVAVVGKTDRPSPAVETRITSVNLNPTWTAPVSLIRKDIIPHMRQDPGYLAKMKIRILDAQGHEVEPTRIDWSTENAVNYTLRQDAGAANALGQIRIDMPNRHAVYMHDTPTKRLFSGGVRFQSSGCVRVADVKIFATWLLEGTPGPNGAAWSEPDLDAAIASAQRQDVQLAKPVPVAWIYLTGYATADGTVHFRDDIYGLDAPSEPALAAGLPPGRG